ncbi:hypothetical protein COS93_00085 [bacterium (Candidatus Gribaldobacteria) CG07_land_8_20_14_0_80_33_18]|uniref:Uncharacterized protein n=1 Tax=bacterium (Candidatus Gribaldobacteria) CG07_land_8_20_14_0_80_33_18 TaxID=2014272 RepID=A0A2M6Z4H7_9BACT|nr:MAG: hypothetical protein COU04_01390 [bacterium (Candidatus Gribaldobacteria) CG10_big_fil_rev_8_21_14_0_10_33_41]PIU47314.1 MAG: hypothetical protein COS93_00085 [bacterium (Candidatus Gribaldobacteria) CG07_land_8_20_14_0_80_33_18]PJA01350.1 MAG: hypothetical protein COX75_00035 [bacterium (Candidatus Gribaldobacteria) CG_4_10_14_0_2_um_filter_33_15]PJB09046.1 MAG: hypothetical protein CO122_00260 [bacterium (Candidatus Gribaldobacteria) CG_4_9_14_3_um_filter_33_9]
MDELIFKIIFSTSIIGLTVIIFRKIPVLTSLPACAGRPASSAGLPAQAGQDKFFLKIFKFVQQFLNKLKITSEKSEKKIENKQNENYWKEIKKS